MEPKIIILEDISTDQYVMEKSPCGFDTVTKVLQKLGKFHALSYFMNDSQDQTIAGYTEGFMNERMQGNLMFINQVMGLASQVVGGWGKDMEQVAEKLAALTPNLFPKLCKIYAANAPGQGYNVLCHGDFHLRNLLFRWGEGPEKVAESIRFVSL